MSAQTFIIRGKVRKTSSTANQCSSAAYPRSSHALCPGNRRAFLRLDFFSAFTCFLCFLCKSPVLASSTCLLTSATSLHLTIFILIFFNFSLLAPACKFYGVLHWTFSTLHSELDNDFILTCISPLAYGIYVWANKTDEYNNSKAGHLEQGGGH